MCYKFFKSDSIIKETETYYVVENGVNVYDISVNRGEYNVIKADKSWALKYINNIPVMEYNNSERVFKLYKVPFDDMNKSAQITFNKFISINNILNDL